MPFLEAMLCLECILESLKNINLIKFRFKSNVWKMVSHTHTKIFTMTVGLQTIGFAEPANEVFLICKRVDLFQGVGNSRQ